MKKTLTAFAFVLFTAATASASPINLGFEAGLTGWTTTLDPTASATVVGSFNDGDGPPYSPYGGSNFLVLQTGATNFAELVSQPFTLAPGETITGVAAFTTLEAPTGTPIFNDQAKVTIINTTTFAGTLLWSASVLGATDGVGQFGSTPWQTWSFTNTGGLANSFTLQYSVQNTDDANFDSFALFDAGQVPDGGSALAMLGLGMVGLSAIRRKFNI